MRIIANPKLNANIRGNFLVVDENNVLKMDGFKTTVDAGSYISFMEKADKPKADRPIAYQYV